MKDISSEARECKVQVLICTNERPDGKSCCHKVGGQEFYLKMKQKIKEADLHHSHWATRTGCLGFCNDVGTAVAIHRQDSPSQWYNEVKMEDFDAIWKEVSK